MIKVIDVNNAVVRLFKAKLKDELKKSIGDVFTEETLPVFKKSLLAIASHKKTFESEVCLQTLENEKIIAILKWSAIGERVITSTQDITERKQAQIKLEESEARFRAFMNNLPAAAYIKNDQLKFLYGNQAARESINTSLEKFIGASTGDFHPSQESKSIEEADRIVLEKDRNVTIEGFLTYPNGEKKWLRDIKFPVIGPNNEKLVGGIALDLTEQKKVEEAIKASEAQFRSLFTAMRSGFALLEAVYDDTGTPNKLRFLHVNPTFEEQVGREAKDLIGKTLLDVFPDFDPRWIAAYAKVVLTGESFEKEDFDPHLNKYFSYKAFSPQKGQVAVISTDINQQKLDQIALQKRAEDLERFNRLSVGRELKMIDLKKEINQLCRDLGEKPRYTTSFNKDAD